MVMDETCVDAADGTSRFGDSTCEVADLEYVLPKTLIAQQPAPQREAARLLALDRASGALRDATIPELPAMLRPGDLLVLNDTKVLPARFRARRRTGGVVDALFIQEESPGRWRLLLRGSRRLHCGESLLVESRNGEQVMLSLVQAVSDGQWIAEVEARGTTEEVLDRIGETPLPPYIRRNPGQPAVDSGDRQRYQTVYARRPGAVAAPTAGLHLSEALLEEIRSRQVETAFVTLHIGPGTFKPIRGAHFANHVMHSESFELPRETAAAVGRCRARGGRVVAVGTTSVRVLEAAACAEPNDRGVRKSRAETDLFIYPPYRFRVVDALLTNFHLPRSTLLALVMAFAGVAGTRRAYRHAIDHKYRFYSYGDAMFVC